MVKVRRTKLETMVKVRRTKLETMVKVRRTKLETMVKVRRTKLETMVNEGNKKAARTVGAVDRLAYLSACQLGVTLASLGLGWIGEPAVSQLLMPVFEWFNVPESATHSISFIVGFSIITTLHIVLGELVPKSLAIVNTEKNANFTALPLIIFYKVTYPIYYLAI